MDNFFLQEDHLQVNFCQKKPINEYFMQNQLDNFFGIDFKENMFQEPCMFNVELKEQHDKDRLFQQKQQSCIQEQTTAMPIQSKPIEYPPCRCYRIHCQKKYCECFRNGRKCTKKCICIDCHNQPIVTRMKVNVEQLWQVSYMFNNIMSKN